jgi:hypothetical protein
MIIDLLATIVHTTALLTYGVEVIQPVPPSELHAVVPFEGRPVAPFFSSARDCRYYGIAVPYARDWEIVSENTLTNTKTVLPPEPGKIHSYAILINKKTCPGKEPERMLIGGSDQSGTGIFRNIGLIKRESFMATDISANPKEQPKWLNQVMKVIEAAEPTKPFVKEFLDYSRAGVTEAKPQQAPAAPAELTAAELNETAATQ